MEVRDYVDSDSEKVMSWFDEHGWDAPPKLLIPPDGLIIDDICCSWVYFGEPRMAIIGWPVTNPAAPRAERYEGLKLVTENLVNLARDRGAKLMFAWASHSGLLNIYGKLDFAVGDQNCTSMVRGL